MMKDCWISLSLFDHMKAQSDALSVTWSVRSRCVVWTDVLLKVVRCWQTYSYIINMERGLNSWVDFTVIGIYFAFVIAVGLLVSWRNKFPRKHWRCAEFLGVLWGFESRFDKSWRGKSALLVFCLYGQPFPWVSCLSRCMLCVLFVRCFLSSDREEE